MTETAQRPLNVKQAAEFLGLSPNYIHQLVHGRKLTAYKPGGKVLYFKVSDLEAYAFRKKSLANFELNAAADRILNGE